LDKLLLPAILKIAEKLLPIIERFNEFRYFLLEGGRGGGKSQAIGRFILYLAEKYKLRIVCGRETQNSITESVYSLLSDLIKAYDLNFDIQANKIVHRKTGSTINFRGFREQGRFNIQGMEGVDILWIDESQAITKQTLDVLIPTIRKENARIFFSMNRHVHNDPVYVKFADRNDCLHIAINFHENPYCPEALKKEAAECRKISEKDYQHIWEGYPLDQSEDALFSLSELLACKNAKHSLAEGYGIRLAGYDPARYGDDKTSATIIQQMGALHWQQIFVDEWEHKDLNYTTGRILSISAENNADKSIIDEDGIGAGPLDTLKKGRGLDSFVGFRNPAISYTENKSYGNNRTVNAYKLKNMVMKGHICIPDDKTIEELLTLKYTFDHNQRRILVSKEKMRKDGVKSPNRADALIMAVSLIGEVKEKQTRQYEGHMPAYSKEENLLNLAGVR